MGSPSIAIYGDPVPWALQVSLFTVIPHPGLVTERLANLTWPLQVSLFTVLPQARPTGRMFDPPAKGFVDFNVLIRKRIVEINESIRDHVDQLISKSTVVHKRVKHPNCQ